MTEKGSQALVQGLQKSTSLQTISLSLKWLKINGFEKLKDPLREMSHFKKIVIDFAW